MVDWKTFSIVVSDYIVFREFEMHDELLLQLNILLYNLLVISVVSLQSLASTNVSVSSYAPIR